MTPVPMQMPNIIWYRLGPNRVQERGTRHGLPRNLTGMSRTATSPIPILTIPATARRGSAPCGTTMRVAINISAMSDEPATTLAPYTQRWPTFRQPEPAPQPGVDAITKTALLPQSVLAPWIPIRRPSAPKMKTIHCPPHNIAVGINHAHTPAIELVSRPASHSPRLVRTISIFTTYP